MVVTAAPGGPPTMPGNGVNDNPVGEINESLSWPLAGLRAPKEDDPGVEADLVGITRPSRAALVRFSSAAPYDFGFNLNHFFKLQIDSLKKDKKTF